MKRLSLLLAALMILSVPCHARDIDESRAMKTAEGSISSVDWVGGVIAVDDFLVSVPSDVKVYKGSDSIGLDDLNIGDPVTVTYYDDPSGVRKAVRITVQYSGDFVV